MKLPFTLKQLRILKAIASEKKFTKAADLLFVSQPTLSKQIKILENELGMLLINRENNKIQLTENGKIFLKYGERILSLCEESCRTLNDIKNNYRKDVIIGTDEIIGNLIISRILTLFIKNYPQFNIKIHINRSKNILKQLTNKNVNIGIITNFLLENQDRKIKIKNFINDEFVLVISNYNLLQIKYNSKILETQFAKFNFIKLNSNAKSYKLNKKQLNAKSKIKKFKNLLNLNSQQAIKIALNLGFGFSFVPKISIKKEKILKLIKPFKIKNIKIQRTIYLLTHVSNNESLSIKYFIYHLYNLKLNVSRSKLVD
uniref:Probable RuBisCO transcriptional regulator n=1 Tax=Toxarium undulatum TaxID=210620 RepID=A0A1D8D9Q6_9STRA|nr:transcription regulator of rubisco operon [Toxarium undulatum]AOS86686.1 transcription regulator of rubisco operon [Toxarium undulatum]